MNSSMPKRLLSTPPQAKIRPGGTKVLRPQAVFPVVIAHKIPTRPAQHSKFQVFQERHDILAEPSFVTQGPTPRHRCRHICTGRGAR